MNHLQLNVHDGRFQATEWQKRTSMVRCVLKVSFPHHGQVSVPQTSCHSFIPI